MKGKRIVNACVLILIVSFAFAGGQSEPAAVVGADANFNKSGLPIVNEPVTLKMIVNMVPMTKDLDTLPMFQDLEKKTNVRIEWELVRSGWNEKKSLILASGDLPDAFFARNSVNDSDIMANPTFFLPLNDLISQYGPNIQKMFDEKPYLKKMAVSSDGNIYGLTSWRGANPSHESITWINKVWLDKLGLRAPTTIDEFYQVLKAFKEKDPNGNGKQDEIPLHFNGVGIHAFGGIDALLSPFGISAPSNANIAPLMVKEGRARLYPAMDEYREAMKFYNKLYSEGLIYSEVFTQADQYANIGKNPEAPTVGVGQHYLHSTLLGKWSVEYTHLLPLQGPGGRNYAYDPGFMRMGKNAFVVTTQNMYPEVTMRWANELYEPMMSMQLYFGSINDRLLVNPDGTFGLVPPPAGKGAGPWGWEHGTSDNSPMYPPDELLAKLTRDPDGHYRANVVEKDLTPYYFPLENVYPPVSFTAEESEVINRRYVTIKSFMDQKLAEFVIQGDVDRKWADYIKVLNDMGLKELEQVYDSAYRRFEGK